ncbi:hypothetical protein ACQP0U_23455 [Micromonospora sp. CA-269861]|uniref:hypothetical protein n=1 Tax=Micromonospora sp. CA-269861 TaxID=3239968 RepID=UPI003D8BE1D9
MVTPLTRAAVTDATAGRSGVLRDVPWRPGTVDTAPPPPARPIEEERPATTQDGQRPATSKDGHPVAGQPPEQRGEAADPSLHP